MLKYKLNKDAPSQSKSIKNQPIASINSNKSLIKLNPNSIQIKSNVSVLNSKEGQNDLSANQVPNRTKSQKLLK